MPVLTGVLLDMSGSMKRGIGGRLNEIWVRTISKVVDDLIKNDVAESDHMFAVGVGASGEVFQMFNTKAKHVSNRGRSKEGILEDALTILEETGAPRIRKWVNMSDLISILSYDDAVLILEKLQHDKIFRRVFVDVLPLQCKEGIAAESLGVFLSKTITEMCIKGQFKCAATLARGVDTLESISKTHTKEVLKIIFDCVKEMELTTEKTDKLREAAGQDSLDGSQVMKALQYARGIFSLTEHQEHDKFLFVVSSSEPTDGGNSILTTLSDLGVHCFLIYDESIFDPLLLFSRTGRCLLLKSTYLTVDLIPKTFFVKRGWKIDLAKNEIRLLCKHTDILSEICDLAKNMGNCHDALSDILGAVSLDIYINQVNKSFCAKEQINSTCYANACAAVFHMAMRRIVGRTDGYPNFFQIRQEIVYKYGIDGGNVNDVLEYMCPKYRLQWEKVDEARAKKAVAAKRPVIAQFFLSGVEAHDEWKAFSDFFSNNSCGILTRSEIDISIRPDDLEDEDFSGHAVVLTSYDNKSLRFMNSWDSKWADGGFFRVEKADVLKFEFFDVFWTLDDLRSEEIDAYKRSGQIAKTLTSSIPGLLSAKYECPQCSVESNISDYSGNMFKAKCPHCLGTFSPKNAELVLKLYLTSLCD